MKRVLFFILLFACCTFAFSPITTAQTLSPYPYKAAVVLSDSGTIFIAERAKEKLPLASLTKLMSAIVLCDMKPHWMSVVTYQRQDDRSGGELLVKPGDRFLVKDAFFTMLVGSANNATITLIRSSGISQSAFVKKMNSKARFLQLQSLHFVEPTGLDSRNVGTALDIAKLTKIALLYPDIRAAASKLQYSFITQNTNKKHVIKNTNSLLGTGKGITAGKTGFINEVGYNIAAEQKQKGKTTFIAVLLGGRTSSVRFNALVILLQNARKKESDS